MGGDADGERSIGRREALRTIAGAAAVTGTARNARAQETTQGGGTTEAGGTTQGGGGGGIDYGGWFDDVGNFDGTVDARGQSRVTVDVGAEGNGGNFAFAPPAVRVDPGTTIAWQWTGKGGAHTVTALSQRFGSDLVSKQGYTFTQTFGSPGITKYYCQPHRTLGMKGAVVVGSPPFGSGGGDGEGGGSSGPFGLPVGSTALALALAGLMALLSPVAFLLVLARNREQLR